MGPRRTLMDLSLYFITMELDLQGRPNSQTWKPFNVLESDQSAVTMDANQPPQLKLPI